MPIKCILRRSQTISRRREHWSG